MPPTRTRVVSVERFCKMVAVQIYNLTVLLDVEKVAIGGGISKQPLLLDDLRRVYAGLFASRGESPYMIGLPRCEIVPCHFSSEANQVGALYTYLQAESKPFNGFPLRSSHIQRNNYFYRANSGRLRSAGSAFSREGVQRKTAFSLFEASAGWDPSGEKGIPENPQIFRNPQ